MVHLAQMRHFVGDDVIDELRAEVQQTPMQADAAVAFGAAPAGGGGAEFHRRHAHAELGREVRHPRGEQSQRLSLQPGGHAVAHLLRTAALRQGQVKFGAGFVPLQLAGAAQPQGEVLAEIRDTAAIGPVDARGLQRLQTLFALSQLALHPGGVLLQKLGDGRAAGQARGMQADAAVVHPQRQGAAGGAVQRPIETVDAVVISLRRHASAG